MVDNMSNTNARILIWGVTALSAFSLFAIQFMNFLPSVWYSQQQIWILVATGLFALAHLVRFLNLANTSIQQNLTTRFIFPMGISIFLWVYLYFAVFFGVGTLYTILFGTKTNLSYTVQSAQYYSASCDNAVALNDTSLIANRVCNVSTKIRKNLNTGDIICLQGRASSLGIFPTKTFLPTNGLKCSLDE